MGILTEAGWNFDNSYAQTLPMLFFEKLEPVKVRQPQIAIFNNTLAESLGLDSEKLNTTEGATYFSGNKLPEGSEPLAQAYAGHQYGHFTMLGDGRAILLGEQITPQGKRVDIQLKGSGRTPYSRGGDGRAALGPMLREYIISEAMAALGIPTTRSLAVVTTGEPVIRETALPGAVLTRVAASHIRVGTFQYASATGEPEAVKVLADYTMNRHFPQSLESENPYLAFLQAVMLNQAKLIAKWQSVGFIHGVMNTDNMTLSGETIDYGPCAFMDAYDPATVFSSIDRHGRYAYSNQPFIAQWNLARLTETLLPLLDMNSEKALALAEEALASFPQLYQQYWLAEMRAKLGLFSEDEGDTALIQSLLSWMHQNNQDYTNTFRALSSDVLPETFCFQDADFKTWHTQWHQRLAQQPQTFSDVQQRMRDHNPSVIPRNHRVEEALQAATEGLDYSVLQRLLSILKSPYVDLDSSEVDFSLPAEPGGEAYRTFCGT